MTSKAMMIHFDDFSNESARFLKEMKKLGWDTQICDDLYSMQAISATVSELKPDLLFLPFCLFDPKKNMDFIGELRESASNWPYTILMHKIEDFSLVNSQSADDFFLYKSWPVKYLESALRRFIIKKPRIMVVEDDPFVAKILCRNVESLGHEVFYCKDGLEALEKVSILYPDVLISDVVMPHIDGYTLCKRLKSNPFTRRIPFLFTSSLSSVDEIQKGITLGAADYITKPYDFEEIRTKITYYIEKTGKKKRKVLVVDDSKMVREMVRKTLVEEGFHVLTATSGTDGLKIAKSELPDLITTDYVMPEVDGWEFCRRLKADEKTRKIPVLMITSKTSEMDKKIGKSLKIDDYLTKPFTPETVINTVNYILLARLSEERRENMQKMEQDLSLAYEIQKKMLPGNLHEICSDVNIAAAWIPAKTLGGDFYDVLYDSENKILTTVIADVSGKGLPASLVAIAAQVCLRTSIHHVNSAGELMKSLNLHLCESTDDQTFVTCFIARIDLKNSRLGWACAGHKSMYLLDKKTLELTDLSMNGLPCGMFQGEYPEGSLDFHENHRLFLYTDGVIEAQNHENELYEMERLNHYLKENSHLPVEDFCLGLVSDVNKFTAGAPQSDDFTILTVDLATLT